MSHMQFVLECYLPVELDHLLQGECGDGPVVCGGDGADFIPERLDIFVASGREVV
jgi:hypothetical protein